MIKAVSTFGIIAITVLIFGNEDLTAASFEKNEAFDSFRVEAESQPVQLIRKKEKYDITELGQTLRKNDEIVTGKQGRATVFFSLLSEDNQVSMGGSSTIRVTYDVLNADKTEYRVMLVSGKIKAKVKSAEGALVQITSETTEILAEDAEFIIESRRDVTTLGVISGTVVLITRDSQLRTQIPQGMMTIVPRNVSTLSLVNIDPLLYEGIEAQKKAVVKDTAVLPEENTDTDQATPEEPEMKPESNLTVPIIPVPIPEVSPIIPESSVALESSPAVPTPAPEILAETNSQVAVIPEKSADNPTLSENPVDASPDKIEEKPVENQKAVFVTLGEEPSADASPDSLMQEEPLQKSETSFLSEYKWDMVASSIFLVSAWLALTDANKYNELAKDNDHITSAYNSASESEKIQLIIEHEVNREKMLLYRQDMDKLNIISFLAIAWESWLLYSHLSGGTDAEKGRENASSKNTIANAIHVFAKNGEGVPCFGVSGSWNW